MDKQALDVLLIGGGMITHDLLLPSLYHLQRLGVIGEIKISALNNAPLRALKDAPEIAEAFPGQSFTPYPDFSKPADANDPELYKNVLAKMPPRQIVVVAIPDQLHYQAVMEALQHDQHVLCVKPLVLQYKQAVEIEKLALEKGLFVGVEYHKRFDRRSLLARRHYHLGYFGEFKIGEAKLIEPYYYRSSNFQNWFTTDKTDPFVYVGCHYVDLVCFITGLRPIEVSVSGIKGRFPNGNEGYMWTNGRLRFENQALLTVTDGLGYPDDGAGNNEQCLTMYCEGGGKTALIEHDDQYRGVTHCFVDDFAPSGVHYKYINPDFFRLVPWTEEGLMPVGYGYESVANIIGAITNLEKSAATYQGAEALTKRRDIIRKIDKQGLIATPANSYLNELVIEAARMSIAGDGAPVEIIYEGTPRVRAR